MTIDVGQLLGELAHLRRERAGFSTTSINIVAFVESDAALLARMSDRIDTLAERNVSRTLLLSCERREHAVRSHCREINDTLMTHSEQIEISVGDAGAEELRSIVHDLIVPNVRTVLLWGGAHLTDPRFTALADLADIVVLFSSAAQPGPESLRELLALVGTPVEPKLRDLAYLRLLTWQDTIAQFFDDPELAAELPHISRVEIGSGSAPEAYYLAGWLASRLGWDPCGKNELCNADGRTIAVDFRRDGEPRRISSIRLHSRNCIFGASVDQRSNDLVCLTVEGHKHRPQRCSPLHDVDMVVLIERAIFETAGTDVYLATLKTAGRLLEHDR